MKDRETARMRKCGESKTTQIMMATVPHVTSGLGLRKFQADGFLLTRVYHWSCEWVGALPPPPLCACIGMSPSVLYLYSVMPITVCQMQEAMHTFVSYLNWYPMSLMPSVPFQHCSIIAHHLLPSSSWKKIQQL